MVTAWHVRFPGWQVTLLGGALMVAARGHLRRAVATRLCRRHSLLHRHRASPVGAGAGAGRCWVCAVWPAGSAIAPHLVHARAGGAGLQLPPVPPTPPGRKPLLVHVWTALGTADHPLRRPAARPLHRRGRCERHDLDRPLGPGAGRRTSTSATTRQSRSTIRRPSSNSCSVPRRTMTWRVGSSPATR